MAINPAVAVGILLASPVQFLKRFPVRIYGDTGASRPVNYTLLNRNPGNSRRPGFVLGSLNMHDTEVLEIRSPAAMAAAAPGAGGSVFNAHSVHMDAGTARMNFYTLDGAGPAVMVTGQLSGCSFVMQPGGAGQVNVAHVQPQGQTGAALQGTLANGLANAEIYGAAGTTGNYDSADRVASVIGVRIGGQWRIYAQKQDAGSGDYRIKSVYQIYPSRRKL